jgi:octaprenyl-diphosphate synthase
MNLIFNEIIKPVNCELKLFKQHFRDEFLSFEPVLGDISQHLLATEGKLLRPILILLSAKMHGNICEKTYIIAKAIEILHTATLIHDDIVDGAEMRRGKPTIQVQWSPQIAVLVGDYFLAKSLDIIAKNKLYEILEALTEVVKQLSEGELFQIHKSLTLDTTEDDYLNIIYKKTASLICASTKFGSMSAEANSHIAEQMTEIGRNIGLAFQIRDDIFDFEKENKAGKLYGNDLREHKLTLPLIYALKNSSPQEQIIIKQKLSQCSENSQYIDDIIEFTLKNNGIDYATAKMKQFCDNAINLLKQFPENTARHSLIMLAKYIAERKS